MEFKLVVSAYQPTAGDLVLNAEVPLSGVKFVEAFGAALRKSIDHIDRCRHVTLGALAIYEMNVPQQMAIESGHYNSVDTYTVYVENDLLKNFLFYQASLRYGATGRPCYPYMSNEATLVSQIDELAFLEAWANTGYATWLKMSGGQMVDATAKPVAPTPPSTGGDTPGCDGCTCPEQPTPPPPCPPPGWNGHHPHKPPHHHPDKPGCCPPPPPPCPCPHPPRPPKPPVIGNPSDPDAGTDLPDAGDVRLDEFTSFEDVYKGVDGNPVDADMNDALEGLLH